MKKILGLLSVFATSSLALTACSFGNKADIWMNQRLLTLLDGVPALGIDRLDEAGEIEWNAPTACLNHASVISEIRNNAFPISIADATFGSRRTLRANGTRAKGWTLDTGDKLLTVDSAMKDLTQEFYYEGKTYLSDGNEQANVYKGHTINYTLGESYLSQGGYMVEEIDYIGKEDSQRIEMVVSGSQTNSRVLRRFNASNDLFKISNIGLIRAKIYNDGILVMAKTERVLYKSAETDAITGDIITVGVAAIDTNTGEMGWATKVNRIGEGVDKIQEEFVHWNAIAPRLETICTESREPVTAVERLQNKIDYFARFETWLAYTGEKRRVEDTTGVYLSGLNEHLEHLSGKSPKDWQEKVYSML